MSFRRWLRNCLLLLAAGTGVADAAWALNCAPTNPSVKVQVQAYFAEAETVFVGQLVDVGDGIHEGWSVSAIGRLKAERWFKGAEAPEVRVLLPAGFPRGARLLVFARTNAPADRLRQTEGRRLYPRLDGKSGDAAVKTTDADIPYLTASGACQTSAFLLDMDSVIPVPGVRDATASAWVVKRSNEMLTALETMPAAGSGGRLQLTLRAYDMGDAERRTQLLAELKEAKDAVRWGVRLNGPSTVRHLGIRWLRPQDSGGGGWDGERMPAGDYLLDLPKLPGYELQCVRQPASDCARVKVEDRGLVRHDLIYMPNARLQVRLVNQQGLPVQGLGLLRVRRLSPNPAGMPFPLQRETSFVARPPYDQSIYFFGLRAGSYAIEWLVPQVASGQPGDWPWERKVLKSKVLALGDGRNVKVIPGDNLLTLTLPAEIRPAELRATVPGCKPGTYLQVELLTEWRPGRSAAMQQTMGEALKDSCEIQYKGFTGQQLRLFYSSGASATPAVAWVELQAGETRLELRPLDAKPQ